MAVNMAQNVLDPLALDEPCAEEEEETEDNTQSVWEHDPLAQIPIKVLRGHTDTVSSCQLALNDQKLVTSSYDKTAILWDVESGEPLRVFERGHTAPVTQCALIPQKNRLITASWDKTLQAWDLETGQTLWSAPQGGLLTSCSVSGDGEVVASATDIENGLYLTCADTGKQITFIKGHHKSTIPRCCFDPLDRHVATVSADKSIKLWDLNSRQTTLSIASSHTNVISNCCFTKDGRYLCTASWDKTLQLWDVTTGTFRSQGGEGHNIGHDGCVSSCMFSDDAALLVSGAYDRTVAVWDMRAICKLLLLKGHMDWVMDVAISADKKWVVSCSKDTTVRLWNIEHTEEIPAVIETRRTQAGGYQIMKCEECARSFSVFRMESDSTTKCVFCRLKAPTTYIPVPPPCF
ncbi:WD repeat-containing protein 88 [Clupea harengus]|uniref:WD repeat-containing protein 88 n=1 Tax=Clupea harengus TaxID=7950 RepID=A0A6P8GVX4_CLUHA|nr:WD repeat-containing protein 88 [Clupea harengus]